MRFLRGLFLNQDGGGAGGGAAAAAAPASGAGAAGAPPAAPASPAAPAAAFDWKTSGMDDAGLAIVTERGWKGPGDLLTSYRNLETAVGVPPERLIKLPAQRDAGDPKIWKDVFSKLGMPETADKYQIPLPEGDKGEFAKVARDWFHKANMTQGQVATLAEAWNAHVKGQADAAKTARENSNLESVTQLKGAWGSNYDNNAALVDKAAEAFGMSQEQLNALKDVLSPKGAMEFLFNIGSKLGIESGAPKGMSDGAGNFSTTPQQAAAELAKFKADPNFAKMFNSADPVVRAEARAKVDRLSKLAAPGMTAA